MNKRILEEMESALRAAINTTQQKIKEEKNPERIQHLRDKLDNQAQKLATVISELVEIETELVTECDYEDPWTIQ